MTFIFYILDIHDQTLNNWQCWGYTMATMIRASLCLYLKELFKTSKISKELFDEASEILNAKDHHKQVRSELMLVVYPIDIMKENKFISMTCVVKRVSC